MDGEVRVPALQNGGAQTWEGGGTAESGGVEGYPNNYPPGYPSNPPEATGEKTDTMKKPTRRPGVKPPPDRAKRSIYLFRLKNPIRQAFIKITEAKWFEIIILLTIMGTCISLAVFTPLPNGDTNATNEFLEEIEIIFTVIFTTECLMRIVALGFIAHPTAYLRNSWNILDFTIVMIG